MPRDAVIHFYTESFEDIQEARKAIENRERALLHRTGINPDFYYRADGGSIVDDFTAMEQRIAKLTPKALKAFSPALYKWAKNTPGIGFHLLARLVGTIGHPCLAEPFHQEVTFDETGRRSRLLIEDEPYIRTVSELWAYCGLGDAQKKPKQGMSQDELMALGLPKAKALVWNIATSCVKAKATSPYGKLYDQVRAKKYGANKLHNRPCHPCAGRGKDPTQVIGKPWRDGHKHAAALRYIGKQMLLDAYYVSLPEVEGALTT